MAKMTLESIGKLNEELIWLKEEVRQQPTHWAYSRIAEIEGILAAHREASAWKETRKILRKFTTA